MENYNQWPLPWFLGQPTSTAQHVYHGPVFSGPGEDNPVIVPSAANNTTTTAVVSTTNTEQSDSSAIDINGTCKMEGRVKYANIGIGHSSRESQSENHGDTSMETDMSVCQTGFPTHYAVGGGTSSDEVSSRFQFRRTDLLFDQNVDHVSTSQPCATNVCEAQNGPKDSVKQKKQKGTVKRDKRVRGVRNVEKWKRNVVKKLRNTGQSYTSYDGKVHRARFVKDGCAASCRYRCHQNISKEDRDNLFTEYWRSGDMLKQREFLTRYVVPVDKITMKSTESRSTRTLKYMFDVRDQRYTVCKTFFLQTLDISERVIVTALKKKTPEGRIEEDMRGKHKSGTRRLSDDTVQKIKSHIDTFPLVDSHYFFRGEKVRFLQPGLTLIKMYGQYAEQCAIENSQPVKYSAYKRIADQYGIAFHTHGKKEDLCFVCNYKSPDSDRSGNDRTETSSETDTQPVAPSSRPICTCVSASGHNPHFLSTYGLEEVSMLSHGHTCGHIY